MFRWLTCKCLVENAGLQAQHVWWLHQLTFIPNHINASPELCAPEHEIPHWLQKCGVVHPPPPNTHTHKKKNPCIGFTWLQISEPQHLCFFPRNPQTMLPCRCQSGSFCLLSACMFVMESSCPLLWWGYYSSSRRQSEGEFMESSGYSNCRRLPGLL